MQKISYVIPCYRSQHTVGGVVAEIAATMQTLPQYDYEVILVNDCSPDLYVRDLHEAVLL